MGEEEDITDVVTCELGCAVRVGVHWAEKEERQQKLSVRGTVAIPWEPVTGLSRFLAPPTPSVTTFFS